MSTRTSHPQTRRGTMMNRLSSVRTTAALLVPVLAATLMTTMPSSAVAAPTTATPADVKGIKVKPVTATQRPEWTASKRELTESDLPADPVVAAGAQTVDLAGAAASTSAARSPSLKGVKAGKLPVYVAAASAPAAAADRAPDARVAGGPVRKVRVEVLDRRSADAAAVNGVVMKLARADGVQQAGQARVTVDYRSFQGLFGGDALSRLRLIRLSDGQPVPSVNDPKAGTLSATLSLAAAGAASSFAVAAAPSGGNGDYKGTSLTPASTWQVSQQNGSFAWSYPIKVPSPPGGMVPEVALSYSSGAIDGRTSGNNTQGSWIGDGWDLWPGFVERSYRGCTDDRDEKEKPNPNNKDVPGGDLCYFNDNATLSLNGSATELVKVAGTDTGNKDDNVQYRGVSDDGARIEMIRDGRDNGDADGTHWRVTTINGTQYYFGRDKGEGGASAGTRTDSVFTAPVFSNHPDEGGYNKDFGKSRVTRAWRWNLDYAVDPNGNTMTYFYNKEVGAYAREGDENKRTDYDRAGSLARIEYGSRRDAPASVRPAARVMFQAADRCLGKCVDANDKPIAKRFPDAPWELHCDKAPCKTQFSPTFWTRKRLSTITTQVYAGTGDTYTDVDSWQLAQTYLQAGGNESTPMWLKSITHNGLVTTAGGLATNDPARAGLVVTDPTVVFNPNADLMPNRVNTPNGHSSLFRSRLETITTESGAQMGISYSKPHCDNAAVPKAWNNTKRCFPQFYGAEGEDPKLDWFHKYVVTRVDVYDNTGGFEHQQTNYDYLDSPAWAYDDSELVEPKKRTWGQFRGYGRVQVRHGVESGVQSRTEYRYFRGMDGDKQPKTDELPPKGTPRPVDVEDSFGGRIDDHPAFAGMLREQITYNGRGDGDWVSGTLNTPEHHGPTASTGTLRAWKVHTANTRERMKLSNGQTRWTKSVTKVNDDNLTTEVNDLGDEANPDDDRCARTEYARNTTTWMLDRVKRTESLSVNCDAPIERPRDVLSETRTYYDNADTHGLPPVRGLPVRAEVLDHWDGQTARYVTVGRTGYDSVGRVTSKSDALSRTTTTSYTPQITGPVTRSTVTNPLGHTTTTDFHPALGVPVKATDANGGITQITYDGAGRLLAIWAPGRAKATYPNDPTVSYAYQLRKTASSTVTTKTLMPTGSTMYRTAVTLHDGLLRPRQTQTQTISGGRAITDTVYDSRGQASWSSNAYYDIDNTAPGTTLVTAHARPEIPALTENVYDGAGRLTDARFVVNGDVKWRTTATYAGEKTSVTPPPGGVATTTVVDARGRKAEIRHYKDPAQAGSDDQVAFDRTTYAYTDRDELASVEGPGSNTWTYKYDLRGNKKSSNDPDAGSSTFEYDKAGQLTSAKDARGKVVAVSYDDLGRKTTTRQGSPDGPKLAEWEYDTLTYGVGKLTKSTRFEYDKTGAQLAYTNAITGYDPVGRPNGSAVTIPASNDGLCVSRTLQPCTFPQTYTYWLNGAIEKIKFPAVAGLPAEDLKHLYNEIGLPGGLLGNRVYAQSVVYNQLDKLIGKNLGEHGTRVGLGYGYDEPTGRLHSFRAIAENKTDVYNIKYQHNDAGAITEITDTPDAGQPAETQCFSYDHLSRLTQAWTPKSLTCAVGPDAAALNQLAPYWRSYTFDAAGNRKTEVIHGVSDNTRTYRYPASGGGPGSKPHAVTQVDTTSGTTQQYAYDPTGNTICRPTGTTANTCAPDGTAGADSQTLNWNDEGRLVKSTDKTGDTNFVYDADGNRIIRRDPTGATLYLPGGTEIRKPKTGDATGTRYYAQAGSIIAVRTPAGVTWMVNDHQGTASATVTDGNNPTITRRRALPFGGERGTAPTSWPDDKGFLGGTKDNTGLTHLGAREYDPGLGRFISVDPLMDLATPQQWNGYSYANDSPITLSDPSGLIPDDCRQFDCYGYNPNTGGCKHGCGSTDNVNYGKKAGLTSTAPNTAAKKYSGRTQQGGRPYPDASKGEKWSREYFAEFYYGQHISVADREHLVNTDMCSTFGQGCEGLDNSVSPVNWAHVAEGLLIFAAIVAAPICAATLMACLTGIAEEASAFYSSGSLLGAAGRVGGVGGAGLGARAATKCNSFAAGTLVLMEDGSYKAIEEIEVGDKVEAIDPETGQTEVTDPETGKTGAPRVIRLHRNLDTDLVDLVVRTPDGAEQTIHTTAHHRFWSASRRWIDAAELDRDERLASGENVAAVTVQAAGRYPGHRYMYDLTVEAIHTYYVMAGKTPVLVHNCPNNLGKSYGTNATVVENPGIKIQGLRGSQQTGHAVDQIIDRGVSPESIMDATRNPIAVVEQNVSGTTRYTYLGRDATVVMRRDGQVVTAWPASMNKPFVEQIIADAQ